MHRHSLSLKYSFTPSDTNTRTKPLPLPQWIIAKVAVGVSCLQSNPVQAFIHKNYYNVKTTVHE